MDRSPTLRKGILDPEVAFVRDAASNATLAPGANATMPNATIQQAVPPALEFSGELYIYGMLAALLGTAIWLTLATWWGMPVSTTHSIVGGVIGAGMFAAATTRRSTSRTS